MVDYWRGDLVFVAGILWTVNHKEAEARVRAVVAELTKLRQGADISQYRLAKLTGLSREAIRLIEGGERSPTLHSLFLICAALEARLDDVLKAGEE